MPKESFLKNRIRSVGFAIKGMFLLLQTEASIKVQFVIALAVTGAGFYFNISNTEWMIQLFAIGMVMGMEGANTAIEKIADYIQPNIDPKIGFIKDISAGAVMIVSIIATIVGLIIYVPKLI
ncbi:diacylglycerol kinase family protein [Flagellimonas sp. HMM57]|uniref:diacylglycerol kinase family protein n=1 Tax=unclassified Flagellimonas TaxID=2644544 RepID=UPI0013D52D96|nr:MULTISPECIES: diacylglycerol kinase family protein [unclassified Flagellimonas]UII75666.1 diacylglycerol kinase family protein [Flagellimonas sp. HMM57]